MAGTAATTIGFFNMLVGATLASFVDRAIDATITPIAVGYLAYGSIALLFQLWGPIRPLRTSAHPGRPMMTRWSLACPACRSSITDLCSDLLKYRNYSEI